MIDQQDQQFQTTLERIEQLLADGGPMTDSTVREHQKELVQSLLDLHAAGLARFVELVLRSGEPGQAIINSLVRDELVQPLLILYGLHPLSLNERVHQAVEKVGPSLAVHGAAAEVLAVTSEVVTLQVQRNGHGVSVDTLRQVLEDAVREAAPDVTEIEITGLEGDAGAGRSGFVLVTDVKRLSASRPVEETVTR